MMRLWVLMVMLPLSTMAIAQDGTADSSGSDLQNWIHFVDWDKVPFALLVFVSVLLIQGVMKRIKAKGVLFCLLLVTIYRQ